MTMFLYYTPLAYNLKINIIMHGNYRKLWPSIYSAFKSMGVYVYTTDCWQDGVRQFYRNKRISDETKAMILKNMKYIG